MLEERLGNLMNDDPTVIESSLAKYGDLVYPERKAYARAAARMKREGMSGAKTVFDIAPRIPERKERRGAQTRAALS